MKHVAGGYRETIRHVRHEIRPTLHIPIGDTVRNMTYYENEPAENIFGQPLPTVDGKILFERRTYHAHQYMVPTWVVERIEVDDVAPAVHEYGYYIVHTAYVWSRILRTDVLMQMDHLSKTENVSEIKEAAEDVLKYPLMPEVRSDEP